MGNVSSEIFENNTDDTWWQNTMEEQRNETQQDLAEFQKELERKHEKRRQLIAEKRKEMADMKQELERYKKENEELKRAQNINENVVEINTLKEENEQLKINLEKLKIELKNADDIASKNKELRLNIAEMQGDLQKLNAELVTIEQERLEYSNHVTALKDVVRVTKNMLEIRQNQNDDLKNKLKTLEELLASNEMKIMSDGLREEYERQLRNIRNLRTLYEERQRIDKKDKEHLQTQLEETQKAVEEEKKTNSELSSRITELEEENSNKYDQISNLQSNLGLSKAECKELQAEIDIINQLFAEILLGFNNSQEIDLDKMIKILEENHDLLTKFANEETNSTTAALPKLLLDLINQIDKQKILDSNIGIEENAISLDKLNEEDIQKPIEIIQSGGLHQLNSAEEIVENLPKVWKILIELLSHQNPPLNDLSGEFCYKAVETPTGSKVKLSVSQTFIRLKDLILEKKFLEREMFRLKHLNTHLEGRLQDQEKRLELVSGELGKTWHVVGKMQRQHQQLHTHEKVLRHELQQKRKLLAELKEDLQYCREKWVLAREKNDTTQEQWKELRKEFAARKMTAEDFNQSAESGYSDDKDSSEDEKGYETDDEDKQEVEHSLVNDLDKRQSNEELCDISLSQNSQINNTEPSSNVSGRTEGTELLGQIDFDSNLTANDETLDEVSELSEHQNEDYDKSHDYLEPKSNEYLEMKQSTSTDTVDKANIVDNSHITNDNTAIITEVQKKSSEFSTTDDVNPETDISEPAEVSTNTPMNDMCTRTPKNTGTIPKTSTSPIEKQTATPTRTPEEILSAREERLRRLEQQCKELVFKVTNTSQRSVNMCNKLDNLHDVYGETRKVVSKLEDESNNDNMHVAEANQEVEEVNEEITGIEGDKNNVSSGAILSSEAQGEASEEKNSSVVLLSKSYEEAVGKEENDIVNIKGGNIQEKKQEDEKKDSKDVDSKVAIENISSGTLSSEALGALNENNVSAEILPSEAHGNVLSDDEK